MKVQLLSSRFRLLVDRLPAMVGRGSQADIQVQDPEVSRKHCRIEELNGLLLIRDVGSTNGTFVNGHPVVETVLISGDRVSLGQTHFLVLYERDTSRAAESNIGSEEQTSVSSSGSPAMTARVPMPVSPAGDEGKVWFPTLSGGQA